MGRQGLAGGGSGGEATQMDDFSDKSAKSYSYLRATAIEQAAVYDGRTNEPAGARFN